MWIVCGNGAPIGLLGNSDDPLKVKADIYLLVKQIK
jgi:hypothetical protein